MATYSGTFSLEMTDLMVPGFHNYTPPFGTKVEDGVSLNPMEVQENMQLPYQTLGSVLEVDCGSLASEAVSGDEVNISVPIERSSVVKMTGCVDGVAYNITLEGTGTMASPFLLFALITDSVGTVTVNNSSIVTDENLFQLFLVDYSGGYVSVSQLSFYREQAEVQPEPDEEDGEEEELPDEEDGEEEELPDEEST